jgi:VIT1/CCC1 family predicted Fe2+/Mn2+ transporter
MPEFHYVNRAGWLRAAMLGANDGIVSTASLIVGVEAADGTRSEILIAALAGWVAGAMSMAAGEYTSVGSQADSEIADLAREERALRESPTVETLELAKIYERRGLARDLARQVASQLMAKDALAAHARDELGLAEDSVARPIWPPWSRRPLIRPALRSPHSRRSRRQQSAYSFSCLPRRLASSPLWARSALGWEARPYSRPS